MSRSTSNGNRFSFAGVAAAAFENRAAIAAACRAVARHVKASYRYACGETEHGKAHAMYVRSADLTVIVLLTPGTDIRLVVVEGDALRSWKQVLEEERGADTLFDGIVVEGQRTPPPAAANARDGSNTGLILSMNRYLPDFVVARAIHLDRCDHRFRRWWLESDSDGERVDAMYVPDVDQTWALVQSGGARELVSKRGFHLDRLRAIHSGGGDFVFKVTP